jgi:hypothetical protein
VVTLAPRLTQVTITLTVERGGARDSDLERYLEREIRRAMDRARYATPAATKLVGLKVEVGEKPTT